MLRIRIGFRRFWQQDFHLAVTFSGSTLLPRMQVLNRMDTPPGGWWYTSQFSGMVFRAHTLDQILRDIRGHNRANGYEENIEEQLCAQMHLDGGWCGEPPPPDPGQERVIGYMDLMRGLESAAKLIAGGGARFVDQAEADRRSAICAGCEFNVEHAACLGCTGFSAALRQFLGARRAAGEEKLKACRLCLCGLKEKVWVSEGMISTRGLELPAWCWQNGSGDPCQDVHEQNQGGQPSGEA